MSSAKLGLSAAARTANTRAIMQANRSRNTGPELLLRSALRKSGLVGYRINLQSIPGRPDVAFTRPKFAVFVHGCFWHRCPDCQPTFPKSNQPFWKRKFALNAERDERKRRQLEALGWEVLEIWECELKRDAVGCAATVAKALARIELHIEADEEVAEMGCAKQAPSQRGSCGRS